MAEDNFDPTHPLYQAISELAGLRADHVALRQGAQLHRYSEAGPGIYAFSRIDVGGGADEYVVAVNTSEVADTATFPTDSPATTFTPILPAGGAPISSAEDGAITVQVPPLDAVIYRAGTPVGSDAEPDPITVSEPAEGAEVSGRVAVRADVGSGDFAEVTFAVSVDGADYEVLGVDDNAPYAVHHDVSGLEPGAGCATGRSSPTSPATSTPTGPRRSSARREPPPTGARYAVVHYQRDDGDYGDQTSDDFNDLWGLHAWGDIVGTIDWTNPRRFVGEDEYGRFAWVELQPGADDMGLIVHRGDTKDGTQTDRFIDPSRTPEVWLRSDDATIYTSQAAADGFATIRYHRDDGDYDGWGLHLWGDAIDPADGTEWDAPRPHDGVDDFGAFWQVPLVDVDATLNFIIHAGDTKDPGPDQSIVPSQQPTAWIVSGDETIHRSRGSAEDVATIHYHRPDGDYGDAGIQRLQGLLGTPRLGRRGVTEPVLAGTAATGAHGPVRHRLRRRPRGRGDAARPHHPPGRRQGPRSGHVPRPRPRRLRGLAAPGRRSRAALRPPDPSRPRPAAATSPRSGRTGCPRTPSCGALPTTRRRRTACTTPRQAGWSSPTTG